ncbi:MAG TPA: putative ATP-grasp-modified RiPP [Mycobacteriales bacterium]|nr:putative ATP-grasp-modified RiPP [Mycobacteriales bacterium]
MDPITVDVQPCPPLGLVFALPVPADPDGSVLSAAFLCPDQQIAVLPDGRPLHEVAPMVATCTAQTNPDGKDPLAVDTDPAHD